MEEFELEALQVMLTEAVFGGWSGLEESEVEGANLRVLKDAGQAVKWRAPGPAWGPLQLVVEVAEEGWRGEFLGDKEEGVAAGPIAGASAAAPGGEGDGQEQAGEDG